MKFPAYATLFFGVGILLLLVQLTAGSLYAFGAISEGLKDQGFGHAVPIPLLGAAGNIGTFVSVYNGWFVDRVGPSISLAVGGSLLGLGYSFLSWLVQMKPSDAREYGALAAFFVVGNGAVLSFLSAYTSAASFVPLPQWVGRSSGTVLGAYAAAAALCAFIFKTVLDNNVIQFFELLSFSSHAISALGAFAVLYLSVKHTHYLSGIAESSAEIGDHESSQEFKALVTESEQESSLSDGLDQEQGGLPSAGQASKTAAPNGGTCDALREYALVAARPAFVFLWFIIFLGLGSALMFVNTIADVAAALTDGHLAASSLTRDCVIAFALSNVAARVVGGALSDALNQRGWSRLWVLLLGCFIGVIAHALIAFCPESESSDVVAAWLVGSSSAVGTAEGFLFLWPIVGREWFGAKKTGVFFTLLNSAVGVGSAVYTAAASGLLHQHSFTEQNENGVLVSHCEGAICFKGSFLAASASNFFAILLGLLVIRAISARSNAGKQVKEVKWPW